MLLSKKNVVSGENGSYFVKYYKFDYLDCLTLS